MKLTDKMVLTITEIAETKAELWDVFDMCSKHQLSSSEESIVIAMYEEAKHQMKSIVDMQKEEEKEINQAIQMESTIKRFKDISIDENVNGFGI